VDLSPEWKLLLGCVRANPTTEDLFLLKRKAVSPDLDWDYITRAACAQGIAPLVYLGLHKSGVTHQLPPAAAEILRSS
jgi:hypothetical protein